MVQVDALRAAHERSDHLSTIAGHGENDTICMMVVVMLM